MNVAIETITAISQGLRPPAAEYGSKSGAGITGASGIARLSAP
jgi:hypothetical protein